MKTAPALVAQPVNSQTVSEVSDYAMVDQRESNESPGGIDKVMHEPNS